MTESTVKAGSLIIRRDETSVRLFQVRTGRVRLYFKSATGGEVLLRILGPGETFGEIACIDGLPFAVSAIAQVDCVIGALDRESLLRLRTKHPAIDELLVLQLARLCRTAMAHLYEAHGLPLASRVASRLVGLSREARSRSDAPFRVAISQHELALMVGASRQAINKILSDMMQDGVITTEYKQVTIIDAAKLRARASNGGAPAAPAHSARGGSSPAEIAVNFRSEDQGAY